MYTKIDFIHEVSRLKMYTWYWYVKTKKVGTVVESCTLTCIANRFRTDNSSRSADGLGLLDLPWYNCMI